MSAISANLTSGPYIADGSQRAFPFNFSVAAEAEISVLLDGAVVSSSLYTVAFGDINGTVTFNAAPANGAAIMLLSAPDFEQASTFESQGAYTLDTVNKINRRAAIRDLVLKDKADRALKVPAGSAAPDLPIGVNGKVLGYASGQFVWVDSDNASVAGSVAAAEVAAGIAVASALTAGADADLAETARDAASISAGLWIDEPTGRAAVANGVVFIAAGASSDKAVDVWQRVSSGSSTLLRTHPSLAALNAGIAAIAGSYQAGRVTDDGFVGAREVVVSAPAQAATVSGKVFTLPSTGAGIQVVLTGDQVGDTTSTFTASIGIVSGTPGTSFPFAIGRWYNSAGAQIGADVALTKLSTAITWTGTQPSGARKFEFAVVPLASTTCRFPNYQKGTAARPTTDAWYLAMLGAGVGDNDPTPVPFMVPDPTMWNQATGRVNVASGFNFFSVSVPDGVNDGDILWVLFDAPVEPGAWLQTIGSRFGASGGGGGSGYQAQILHLSDHRFGVALYVQSAADGTFYGPRWTWLNSGAATYFENIRLYVGPKPPWLEKTSAVILKGIRDEIESARIKPLITLADDSCGIAGNNVDPSPGKYLTKLLGSSARFQNMATPGNTLVQSASTVGLLPIRVTTAMTIPASTAAVQIPSWDYDPITTLSTVNPDYDGYAYLCGVLGLLTAVGWTGNSPTQLWFTPVTAPAWPRPVPAGSKLILRCSRRRKGGLTLFPLSSVNGVGGFGNNNVAFADAVFAANDPMTIAGFVGLTPGPGYDTGAAFLTALAGKSYASRLYNPNIMSAATVAEAMALFGWTWAVGELASWTAGTLGLPGSMRFVGDGFHPTTPVASYVSAKNHFISAPVTAFLEAWA